MTKKIKRFSLLLYTIISIVYMELLLRILVKASFISKGLVISLLFAMAFAILIYLLISIFRSKANRIISCFLMMLVALIYASQFVYNDFFGTYYSLFSALNAGQLTDFITDIIFRILKNIHWILLFLLPAILLIAFGKRFLSFDRSPLKLKGLLALGLVIVHLLNLGLINSGDKGLHSPYDLYYKSSYPILSVDRLGLITTMRLDTQRLISGWTPVIESVNPYEPAGPSHDPNDPSDPKGPGDEPVEEPVVEYNILDIDFDKLIGQEEDQEIRDMHEYFKCVPPTKKNEYTGKFKDYNLIFITAEAFSSYAVHKDITPTLYKMVNEGYQFTDFYVPLWDVSTSDGEYVAMTGLIPKSGVWSFYHSSKIDLPFVMGRQFEKLGYNTLAYHNHTYDYYRRDLSHPNLGYDYKGVGNGLDMVSQWPRSDLEMMELTIAEFIDKEPFHVYYLTVSGHLEYNFIGNAMAIKNRDKVDHLDYSTAAKAYYATQIELDRALEHLLGQLEEAGIADRTLIALSADHYPYGLDDKVVNELVGHEVEKNFEIHKNTFILYSKGMEPVVVDKPASALDIVPTLSNLLGLDYDSRLLMGRDIFSDSEPLVIFRNHSFITDKGRYNAVTKEFVANDGAEVDQEYIDYISDIVKSKFHYSTKILDTDYYSRLNID
ncbi:MAG: sulfatase-like hydrolase/transferase [Caldicoprobacterales bacterium]|jgi:phosphoglycerol transferase MdoB-like AlkP superfamily enzyme|nr:sulfatase-like hydrolase/transferase [Clostridia bacterium]